MDQRKTPARSCLAECRTGFGEQAEDCKPEQKLADCRSVVALLEQELLWPQLRFELAGWADLEQSK